MKRLARFFRQKPGMFYTNLANEQLFKIDVIYFVPTNIDVLEERKLEEKTI